MGDLERFVESLLEETKDTKFTDFEKKVYRYLLSLPIGKTVTYKQVAEAIGSPGAMRAVGNALNKNPFPLLIPCHRVLSSKGIGGYSKGIETKKKLLGLEQKIKEMIE